MPTCFNNFLDFRNFQNFIQVYPMDIIHRWKNFVRIYIKIFEKSLSKKI